MTNNPRGHTKYIGYTWKLCPYSDEYSALYYANTIPGPSNHADLFNNDSWVALSTTPHTTTSGTMEYSYSGGSGWICKDPACYHYVTEVPGVWFYET